MYNIDNLVLDRVTRLTKQDISSGDIEWTANQIKDGTLECGGEAVNATDNVGATIGSFDRTKTSKFTASNSVINLGVFADQLGTKKEVGAADKKVVTKKVDVLEANPTAKTITLNWTPLTTSPVTAIWALTTEGGLGEKFAVTASDLATNKTNFTIAGKTITLGDDIPVKREDGSPMTFIVIYKCEMENAVKITNSSDNFSKAGTFVLDSICHDVCDPSTKIYTIIVFERAKLSNNFSLEIKPDGTQPIEFEGMTNYCSKDKEQFYVVIPEDEGEA